MSTEKISERSTGGNSEKSLDEILEETREEIQKKKTLANLQEQKPIMNSRKNSARNRGKNSVRNETKEFRKGRISRKNLG